LRARILWLLALGFATLVVGSSLWDESSLAASRGEALVAVPLDQVDCPSLQDSDWFSLGADGASKATGKVCSICPHPLATLSSFLILNRCRLLPPLTHTLQELSVCLRV
jgi:hypothetical protein